MGLDNSEKSDLDIVDFINSLGLNLPFDIEHFSKNEVEIFLKKILQRADSSNVQAQISPLNFSMLFRKDLNKREENDIATNKYNEEEFNRKSLEHYFRKRISQYSAHYSYNYHDSDEYGDDIDPPEIREIRKDEADQASEFMLNPQINIYRINLRRSLILELLNLREFSKILELKNKSYKILTGIKNLFVDITYSTTLLSLWLDNVRKVKVYHHHEYSRIGKSHRYTESEVEGKDDIRLEKYKTRLITIDDIKAKYNIKLSKNDLEHLDTEHYDGTRNYIEYLNIYPLMQSAVRNIKEGYDSLKELISILTLDSNLLVSQLFKDINFEVLSTLLELPLSLKDQRFSNLDLDYLQYKKLEDQLQSTCKTLADWLLPLGSLIELTSLIKKEDWNIVTFDDSQPYKYIGGWNPLYPKNEQIINDSVGEEPVSILSGANSSGKSRTLDTDMYIRVIAQSIGFSTVSYHSNLQLSRSFYKINRPTSDHINDLSAFMNEVKQLNGVLSRILPGSIVYLDEPFSTTSAEDQAILSENLLRYLRKIDIKIIVATHNEVLIKRMAKNLFAEIYNLKTGTDSEGQLVREFKLNKGQGDSFSIEVAKANSFPIDVLQSAQEYLNGSFKMQELVQHFPEIISYTEPERNVLKNLSSDLSKLWIDDDWNSSFHSFTTDSMFSVDNFYPIENDLEEFGGRRFFSNQNNYRKLMVKFFIGIENLTPQEILERQKIFDELLSKEKWKEILKNLGVLEILKFNTNIIHRVKDKINFALNIFNKDEQIYSISLPNLNYSISYLELNKKLLNEKFTTDLLDELVSLKETFIEIGLNDEFDMLFSDLEKHAENISEELQSRYKYLMLRLVNLESELPAINYSEVDWNFYVKDLQTLAKGGYFNEDNEQKSQLYKDEIPFVVKALLEHTTESPKVQNLIAILKSCDSVYLHQLANFFSIDQIELNIDSKQESGRDVYDKNFYNNLAKARKAYSDKTINSHFKRNSINFFDFFDSDKSPLIQSIERLSTLCAFALTIQKRGLSRVKFNSTGEINIEQPHPFIKKDAIINDISFQANEAIQLLTGPNGSGKTFDGKATIITSLIALSTGYCPSQSATLPAFAKVIYLDRVISKLDDNFSSFTQGIEYWKKILEIAKSGKPFLFFADEGFSETSPKYQAAFLAAIVQVLLKSSGKSIISSHNHRLIESLQNLKSVKPYHFDFNIVDGRIKYKHKKVPGHAKSYAMEVARIMEMPKEITDPEA